MINQLVTKHLSKAFDTTLRDTITAFAATRKGENEEYDPETGDYVTNNDVAYIGRGVFGKYNDFEIASTQVSISDIKLTCLQDEVFDVPTVDDIIVTKGAERRVLSVTQDPSSSIWSIQLRGLHVG